MAYPSELFGETLRWRLKHTRTLGCRHLLTARPTIRARVLVHPLLRSNILVKGDATRRVNLRRVWLADAASPSAPTGFVPCLLNLSLGRVVGQSSILGRRGV